MGSSNQFVSENINGINLHHLQINKFKTNTIVINFTQDLTEENVTKIALLPHILKRGSKRYPSFKHIQEKLDDLYGAIFHAGVFKRGEKQIVQLSLEIANDNFVKTETSLLIEGLRLLGDILINPIVIDQGFNKDYLESEKEMLANRINSILDDKIQYAEFKTIENMCNNEPYRLLAYGKTEDLSKIDEVNLYEFYQTWLKQSPIDFFIVGNFDKNEVINEINNSFIIKGRNAQNLSSNSLQKNIVEQKQIIDELDVKQGKLNIGLRTNTTILDNDKDYISLIMFNGILGGYAHSKLFINVREKASLAYYASSRLDSHKGIIIIQSGIEIDNYQKALEIMKNQLEIIKKGDITVQELEQTKAVYSNQLRETLDQPRMMIDFFFHSVLSNKKRLLEDILGAVEKATVDDVVNIAKKIELDTIYFLKNRSKEAK